METDRCRIVIIGSGNVATRLAEALDKVHRVVQVWSRNIDNAASLADKLSDASATDSLAKIDRNANFYIICTSDDTIATVASQLSGIKGTVAHTSGSVGLETLRNSVGPDTPTGILYPLQSFSKSREIKLAHVPILIEGCDKATAERLKRLAMSFSEKVFEADSELRSKLHLAAVFANNFVNHLWAVSDRYLRQHTNYDITLFAPLLAETLDKAMNIGPYLSQTGPAVRGDTSVIGKHLEMLDDENVANLYKTLTDSIINYHLQKNE